MKRKVNVRVREGKGGGEYSRVGYKEKIKAPEGPAKKCGKKGKVVSKHSGDEDEGRAGGGVHNRGLLWGGETGLRLQQQKQQNGSNLHRSPPHHDEKTASRNQRDM